MLLTGLPACQKEHNRHAHGHPISDLIEDNGLGTVGHIAGDLNAPAFIGPDLMTTTF